MRELERAAKKGGAGTNGGVDLQALTAGAVESGALRVLAVEAPDGTLGDALLELADRLKGALGPSAVVLGAKDGDGAVQLVASLTPEAVAQGLSAAVAVRAAAAIVGAEAADGRRWRAPAARTRRASARRSTLRAPCSSTRSERHLSVRVLALDYGSGRTGVAISDASGTLARPLTIVRRAAARARVSPSCLRSSSASGPS